MANYLAVVTLFAFVFTPAHILAADECGDKGCFVQMCQCPCSGSTGVPWPGGAGGAGAGSAGAGSAGAGGAGAGGNVDAHSVFGKDSMALHNYNETLLRVQKEFNLTWEPPSDQSGLNCVGIYLDCIQYETKINEDIALYSTIADKCRAKARPTPPCVANDEGLGEDGA